ncbi:MAG TPA: lyase family protein [Nitrososphaerales archaeon]|nr:lyase family protein [Nitrososphaerales archaeon]
MSFDSISPIDGRYRTEAEALAGYFSERSLTRERIRVELSYLRLLVKLGVAPRVRVPRVEPNMVEIKRLEEELGHDVKAVEVFLRRSLKRSGAAPLSPYVHIGLTSEDTNSLAYALLLKSSLKEVLVPAYSSLATELAKIARREAATPMVARTHGRPAVPTTFGKEMAVFAVRVAERVSVLRRLRPMAKITGAVGTFASFTLLGARDWPEELSRFVAGLGVEPATYSTQVVPGERISDILHQIININQLVLSLSRDLWLYQTLDLVHFLRPGKVSSSTMPQKVNPVDLENAEGQVEVSNSLLILLAYRLQVTRLQRDLSDSVVRRMLGQALAHSLVATSRLRTSLSSMKIERSTMARDLKAHPQVYAEREQISLRLRGDERGYEKIKAGIEAGKFFPTRKRVDLYLGVAPVLARRCPSVVRRLLTL